MPSVSDSLEAAISVWSGLPSDQFTNEDELAEIWVRGGKTLPYDPVGISALKDAIRRRKVFRNCPLASEENMPDGMFREGGGLVSFITLFVHLENCG